MGRGVNAKGQGWGWETAWWSSHPCIPILRPGVVTAAGSMVWARGAYLLFIRVEDLDNIFLVNTNNVLLGRLGSSDAGLEDGPHPHRDVEAGGTGVIVVQLHSATQRIIYI